MYRRLKFRRAKCRLLITSVLIRIWIIQKLPTTRTCATPPKPTFLQCSEQELSYPTTKTIAPAATNTWAPVLFSARWAVKTSYKLSRGLSISPTSLLTTWSQCRAKKLFSDQSRTTTTISHKQSRKHSNPERKSFTKKHCNRKQSQPKSRKQPKRQLIKKTQCEIWATMQPNLPTNNLVRPSSPALKQLVSRSIKVWLLLSNFTSWLVPSKNSLCFMYPQHKLSFQTLIRRSRSGKFLWVTSDLLTNLRMQKANNPSTLFRPGMLRLQWWRRSQAHSIAAKVCRRQSRQLGALQLTAY